MATDVRVTQGYAQALAEDTSVQTIRATQGYVMVLFEDVEPVDVRVTQGFAQAINYEPGTRTWEPMQLMF